MSLLARAPQASSRLATTSASLALALLVACSGEATPDAGGSESGGGSSAPAANAAAQPTQPAPAPVAVRPANAPPDDPVFGEPLIIDGEVIPFEQIRRFLAMGEYGSPLIETKKHEIYIQQELDRREAAGEDISMFTVEESKIDDAIDELNTKLEEEYPEGGVSLDQAFPTIKPTKNKEGFRSRLRITQLFDQVFLPDNPYELPAITITALDEAAPEAKMVENLKTAWDQQQAQAADDPESKKQADGMNFFKTMQRSLVLQHLEKNAVIEYPDDGLPDDVLLRVDGIDIKVDDVWPEVANLITSKDIEQAKKWLLNTTLAERALRASGNWIEGDEFDAVYKEVHDPYKDSPFSIERVALLYRKFPSLPAYRTYFRIYQSYKKSIADEITDDALRDRLDRLDLLLAGQVDVDIILLSAYDFAKGEWKENGWADAQARAEDVAKQLFDGKPWDDAVEEYSEFWDAPLPKSPEAQANVVRHNKGRYVAVKRNDLMRRLEESDYSTFLDSSSLTDHIFYGMEPGQPSNPLKGPYGYYIPLVKNRTLTARKASLDNETHRSLLEQDYVTARLNRFLWELKEKTSVYGIEG